MTVSVFLLLHIKQILLLLENSAWKMKRIWFCWATLHSWSSKGIYCRSNPCFLNHGVEKKILTGDSEKVTRTICRRVGLKVSIPCLWRKGRFRSPGQGFWKLNRQQSVFPSNQALLKAFDLATFEATKKWTLSLRDWGRVYGEICIIYEGRLPD